MREPEKDTNYTLDIIYANNKMAINYLLNEKHLQKNKTTLVSKTKQKTTKKTRYTMKLRAAFTMPPESFK